MMTLNGPIAERLRLLMIAGIFVAGLGVAACNKTTNDSSGAGTTGKDAVVPMPTTEGTTPEAPATTPSSSMATTGASKIGNVVAIKAESTPEIAPNIVWKSADGTERSLADYRGKVVMLNFWGTWCPPCRRELPAIVKLRNELGQDKFEVIGINVSEEAVPGSTIEDLVAEFAQKNGLAYPLVIGNDELVRAYGGIQAVPTTFIINAEGKIVETIVGGRDEAAFRAAISKAM